MLQGTRIRARARERIHNRFLIHIVNIYEQEQDYEK